MASSSARFPDITNHWARPFIEALARRGILNGYSDGTFRPDNSVTRAEFAAIITTTFSRIPKKREYVSFVDVPDSLWAASAIRKAYETVFITGFPNNYFRPADRIQRINALLSIVSGLSMTSKVSSDLLPALGQIYQDAYAIPDYAKPTAAITTRAGMVASYPNPKLLNPTLAATRADISAFVYQALVWLGEEEKIASPYIVQPPSKVNIPTPPPGSIQIEPNREFRGAWVASVWNSDWPSRAGLSVDQQKAELIQILDKLQELNFNALILQVRPEGDALYPSKYEPWSAWLTGIQGKAPGYDPLEFAIAECHKRNIEFHAWFNPYRASTSYNTKNVAPHIAVTNPQVVYRWGTQLWMDPGAEVVQDRAYNVIMDVVQRYDIDGVHLDDYFYPYPISGESFPDRKTYTAYQNAGGKLSLNDWRRDNVNRMVQRLWSGINSIKSHVKFGISPFGIYRPGEPSGIQGLDAYDVLYADAKKWLQQGWLDYIAPQLYWRIDQTAQSYPTLLKWWTSINSKQRHVYAGNTIARLDGEAWTQAEIIKQVTISRSLNKMSLGNIFFSVNAIKENRQGIAEKFKSLLYREPALVPVMQWRNTLPPASPIQVEANNRKITWATGGGEIRYWTLYKKTGNEWKLQRVLSKGTTFATVESGTYALCAVDRLANQSAGVIISA
ncbi:glycoside hydrolase family 10 protein [Rivularia sp. UHCC 0363]|uniref:glycoside hydrolase family 10 protein n=1 Tax=Rivularia sp. UHCC 0363 TaxID=3110244 RepID=UPI002B2102E7|nr:family 10 glycosylhydrolase [Rivularia sp. UHCC 0363]MEA5598977.1 family 10 glycosylhydrolase [Rivularia sp. UHCC 0363]